MSFDEFWAIFPRRCGKLTARKAWSKALKHSPEIEILEGARRYAVERRDENPKFTKHPSTWLNGGCWMDEASPTHHEKGFAELADDLRREIAREGNGHADRDTEPDLFGSTAISWTGNR